MVPFAPQVLRRWLAPYGRCLGEHKTLIFRSASRTRNVQAGCLLVIHTSEGPLALLLDLTKRLQVAAGDPSVRELERA